MCERSETFERKVIDLKNRDGVVATCDIQSARQQRWVRGEKPEVPRSAFFEDFTTDPQSKFLHDHITKEVSRRGTLGGRKKQSPVTSELEPARPARPQRATPPARSITAPARPQAHPPPDLSPGGHQDIDARHGNIFAEMDDETLQNAFEHSTDLRF